MERFGRLLLTLLLFAGPVAFVGADDGLLPAGLYDDADTDAAPLPPVDPGPAPAMAAPGPPLAIARLDATGRREPVAWAGERAPTVPRAPPSA